VKNALAIATKRAWIIFALMLAAGISACTSGPEQKPGTKPALIDVRSGVRYYAADWNLTNQDHTVDKVAEPVGGMFAFVSKLHYPLYGLKRVGGVVHMRVALDAAGNVLTAQVTQPVHPALAAIVLRAVRETRWKPAMKGGKPVAWTLKFPVTFPARY
jgi:TonB family protein